MKNLPLLIKDKREGEIYKFNLFISEDGMSYFGRISLSVGYECITKKRASFCWDGKGGTVVFGANSIEEGIEKMKSVLEEDKNWEKVERYPN